MADESWVPSFEYQDGHWVVHYAGRDWLLVTQPTVDPGGATYTTWDGAVRGSIWDRVKLSFDMHLIPPPQTFPSRTTSS